MAEIRQGLLFVTLGLTPSIDQSSAWVEGWLQALADDKPTIFRAASDAQKAVDLIEAHCDSDAQPVVETKAEVAQ